MRLKQELDAIKAAFNRTVSPHVVSTLRAETHELIASGLAARALKAGDRAPTCSLTDARGRTVGLQELLATGPLVVTFYRGSWCPYCTVNLRSLEAASSEIRARGGRLIAVSPQTRAHSRRTRSDNALHFSLFSDEDGVAAAAFGIRWSVSPEMRPLYRKLGADIEAFNGEPSWMLPMPARYVIGRDGVIEYAEITPDYTQRPEPCELFPILQKLNASAGTFFRRPLS